MDHPFTRSGHGTAPFTFIRCYVKTYQACQGAPVQPGGSCDHCGTGIHYHFVIRSAEGDEFVVGSSCVEKTPDRKLIRVVRFQMSRMQQERKRAQRAEEDRLSARRNAAAARSFLADHPGLHRSLTTDNVTTRDIARKLALRGSLSERQVSYVHSLARQVERAAEWKAQEQQLLDVPISIGRVELTGRILTTKLKESDWGTSLKMMVMVETAGGNFKVWGSVPRAIEESTVDELRGQQIRFTAMVEPSRQDPKFGFFKRPTKASIIEAQEAPCQ